MIHLKRKEVAKFLSGMAAHEALTHTLLSGSGLLPLTAFGITVTPGYNAVIILGWFAVTIALVYYAWIKK